MLKIELDAGVHNSILLEIIAYFLVFSNNLVVCELS